MTSSGMQIPVNRSVSDLPIYLDRKWARCCSHVGFGEHLRAVLSVLRPFARRFPNTGPGSLARPCRARFSRACSPDKGVQQSIQAAARNSGPFSATKVSSRGA